MEIETVMSYMASSVDPDGVRAQKIKESLAEPLAAERRRARRPAPPTRRVLPPIRPMNAAVILGAVLRALGAAFRRAGRRR